MDVEGKQETYCRFDFLLIYSSPIFPFFSIVFLLFSPLLYSSFLTFFMFLFYFIFCIRLILYSRSSTAIVPTVVPDDVDASQSSQPAVLIGALESTDRRQCLFVSFVYSGSWRPTCLQLQVGEPKRGRREPFLVMFLYVMFTLTTKWHSPIPASALSALSWMVFGTKRRLKLNERKQATARSGLVTTCGKLLWESLEIINIWRTGTGRET